MSATTWNPRSDTDLLTDELSQHHMAKQQEIEEFSLLGALFQHVLHIDSYENKLCVLSEIREACLALKSAYPSKIHPEKNATMLDVMLKNMAKIEAKVFSHDLHPCHARYFTQFSQAIEKSVDTFEDEANTLKILKLGNELFQHDLQSDSGPDLLDRSSRQSKYRPLRR